MIAYIINYKDVEKRKSMPSGMLVTHPLSVQVIAVGKSSLSILLVNLFNQGLKLPFLTPLYERIELKIKPKDLQSFEEVAPIYFERASLSMVKIEVRAPLSGFVPVDLDLTASYVDNPFEKIEIGAAS